MRLVRGTLAARPDPAVLAHQQRLQDIYADLSKERLALARKLVHRVRRGRDGRLIDWPCLSCAGTGKYDKADCGWCGGAGRADWLGRAHFEIALGLAQPSKRWPPV